MLEDFLHYVWKFQKFNNLDLKTVDGDRIIIVKIGDHNHNSGPDFFNSQIEINDQIWAGNLEIHIKSSDWYVHNHHDDTNYDNVILHVVWEHDVDIYRQDNSIIPTLELKRHISYPTFANYEKLLKGTKQFINCEKDIGSIDSFKIQNWLDRLYIERLEQKAIGIFALLEKTNNDWEAVLFKLLARNFGLKLNSDAFYSMANSFDFSLIRKLRDKDLFLEALFFGQSSLLNQTNTDNYYQNLQNIYLQLINKYKLKRNGMIPLKFFRMRPNNFPTIRLSQLASLYQREHKLFSILLEAKNINTVYSIFNVSASDFWKTHYNFQTRSKPSIKKLSKNFIDLLMLNTVIPLKLCYSKIYPSKNIQGIHSLARDLKSESNSLVNTFFRLIEAPNNALNSQALIQLKKYYCDQNRCLSCVVGHSLLNS